MKNSFTKLFEKFILRHKQYNLWYRILLGVGFFVVFITTYMLILPAVTMEHNKTPICGMEEHTHGEECFEEVQVLICGLEENEEHTHDDSCFVTETNLICTMEEHTHTDECFESEETSDEVEDVSVEENISVDGDVSAEDNYIGNNEEETTQDTTNKEMNGIVSDDAEWFVDSSGDEVLSGGALEIVTTETNSEQTVEPYTEETTIMTLEDEVELKMALYAMADGNIDDLGWELSLNSGGDYKLRFSGSGTIPSNFFEESGLAQYGELITGVEISSGVTEIGSNAFKGCTKIKYVNIDNDSMLTSIGEGAFSGCTKLNSINLENCSMLETIGNSSANNTTEENGVFYNTAISEITIPASVTSVDGYSFSQCQDLVNVIIEENSKINVFGKGVFYGCTSMESINIENCKEDSIKVGESLFEKCTALKTLNVPSGFKSVRFICRGCKSLESITFEQNTNITSGYDTSGILDNDCKVVEVLDLTPFVNLEYIDNWGIRGGMNTVMIPKSVKTLNTGAFSDCPNLNVVVFEQGSQLTTILGSEAFARDKMLTSIDLSDTKITSIPTTCFKDCVILETVKIPSTVESIESNAFNNCIGLNNLYYNAKNLNNVGTNIFTGANTNITLTIGPDVDTIPEEFLSQAKDYIGSVVFEGPNTFEIPADFTDLPSPLNKAGKYYTSSDGSVYRLNDNTAELVYANKDKKGTFNVPENVDGKYRVTSVGTYAFKNSFFTEVTFENINNIKNISDYAFAECKNLTTIAGKNTVDEADALLKANATVGLNPYYNTVIGQNTVEVPFDSGTRADDSTINLGRNIGATYELVLKNSGRPTGEYLTGETGNVSVNVSDSGEHYVCRIYFKCEEGCVPKSSNTEIVYKATNDPNIYYYELESLSDGVTRTFQPSFCYKDGTAPGKKVYVWAAIDKNDKFKNVDDVIKPGDNIDGIEVSSEYIEMVWNTERRILNVSKTAEGSPVLKVISDGNTAIGNLNYNIVLQSEGTDGQLDKLGSDYIRYIDYKDTLSLPEGIRWRDNIDSSNTRYTVRGTTGTLYATINGKEYVVCNVSLKNENITELSLKKENDGKISVCWRVVNSNSATDISAVNATLMFGPEILLVNEAKEGSSYTIDNTVSADMQYTFSELVSKNAEAPVIVDSGSGNIKIKKERLSDPEYMGDDVVYRVTLENPTAFDYTNLGTINDQLYTGTDTTQYITPENMYAMFNLESGIRDAKYMSIVISNAMLVTPTKGTVTTVDGKDTANTSAQNTGELTEYSGCKDYDNDIITDNATLTLSYKGEALVLEYKYPDGTGGSIDVGSDIRAALESIGYIVTQKDCYNIIWNYPENDCTIKGGEKREFEFTTTVKNSFMFLPSDQVYSYDYWGPNKLNTLNTVYVADRNGNHIDTANCGTKEVKREIELFKSVLLNGQEVGDDLIIDGDAVLDYNLRIEHIGTNSYNLLPVVDHMYGRQVVLAAVDDNRGADWVADCDNYIDSNGKEYYVLNKNKTYKGVWLNNFYADSVVVKPSEGGYDTIIKWYLKDTDSDSYTLNIGYKAVSTQELAGNENTVGSFTVGNEAWLNDHQTHRIYDIVFGGGSAFSFDKKIVDIEEDLPKDDLIDADDTSPISKVNNKVIYRLSFECVGNADSVLKGSDIYDKLPRTDNEVTNQNIFSWNKAENVKLHYKCDDGVKITYNEKNLIEGNDGDEWSLTDLNPEISGDTQTGQQYIVWDDGFVVNFTGNGQKAYIYVELTFPGDDATWEKYLEARGKDTLSNTLYAYGMPKTVTHNLSDPAKVLLQKGVYETGYYINETDHGSKVAYYRGADRYHYNDNHDNNSIVKNTVTYYVILRNSGKTNLYLAPVYDVLPKGFEYMALRCIAYGNDWHEVGGMESYWTAQSSPTQYGGFSNYAHNLIAVPETFEPNDENFVKATVLYKGTETTSDGKNRLKFEFEDASDGDHNLLQDDNGYKYLKPGQYIQFAYTCYTGNGNDADVAAINKAVNTTAMEYYDPYNAGAELTADIDTGVKVSNHNGMLANDGSRNVWDNTEAAAAGFTEKLGDEPQWLVSDVAVTKGKIIPGITKMATSEDIIMPTEGDVNVDWKIISHSNGTMPITNYIIEDVMEYPHIIKGKVKYSLYSNQSRNYSNGSEADKKLLQSVDPLFTVGDRTNTSDGKEFVKISYFKYDSWSQLTELNLEVDGPSQKIYAQLQREGVFTTKSNSELWVSMESVKDKNGNKTGEKLKIEFTDPKWSIIQNGYSVLELSTVDPTRSEGMFINKAEIIPKEQEYIATDVTQGQNHFEDEANVGVVNRVPITVFKDYPTKSVKKIAEVDNPNNNAASNEDVNYICLDNKGKVFTYTLEVDNKESAMDKLVIIDNLPEVGDHSTMRDDFARYSDFNVSFADNPDPKVIINGRVLSSSEFEIQYSSKTSFNADDWKGGNADNEWSASPSKARSVRLVIDDSANTGNENRLIFANAKIEFKFNAIIDDKDAVPGQIAWNSFAYMYNIGDSVLFAAPLNVGVRIPSVPSLYKNIVNSKNNPFNAVDNQEFGFIIYKGEPLSIDDYSKENIAGLLNDREFTYITLSVPSGKSKSDEKVLYGNFDNTKSLHRYSFSNGNLVENTELWQWIDGEKYNIVEVEFDGNYNYSSTNDVSNQRNYTFTYNSGENQKLIFANAVSDWSIILNKTDENGNKLEGAVFGLYSLDPTDELSETSFNALAEKYKFDDSIKRELIIDGVTYYLKSIEESLSNGKIYWNDLSDDEYLVLELKAPLGYSKDNDYHIIRRSQLEGNSLQYALTVVNSLGINLPDTGGFGITALPKIIGTLMIGFAIFCLIGLKVKHCK